jgi:hypothetical protein
VLSIYFLALPQTFLTLGKTSVVPQAESPFDRGKTKKEKGRGFGPLRDDGRFSLSELHEGKAVIQEPCDNPSP